MDCVQVLLIFCGDIYPGKGGRAKCQVQTSPPILAKSKKWGGWRSGFYIHEIATPLHFLVGLAMMKIISPAGSKT
jgi:hypothetical protein